MRLANRQIRVATPATALKAIPNKAPFMATDIPPAISCACDEPVPAPTALLAASTPVVTATTVTHADASVISALTAGAQNRAPRCTPNVASTAQPMATTSRKRNEATHVQ